MKAYSTGMNYARHRMEEIQNTEELADGRLHALERHCPARKVL